MHVVMVLQVFSPSAIIGLVLLQRGKGADAGAGFGAGASGTVFGARGARTALSRATAIFAAIFMINSLALAYMGSQRSPSSRSRFWTRRRRDGPAPQRPQCPPPQRGAGRAGAPAGNGHGQRRAVIVREFSFFARRGGIGRHTSLRG